VNAANVRLHAKADEKAQSSRVYEETRADAQDVRVTTAGPSHLPDHKMAREEDASASQKACIKDEDAGRPVSESSTANYLATETMDIATDARSTRARRAQDKAKIVRQDAKRCVSKEPDTEDAQELTWSEEVQHSATTRGH
jgi:hypothetical protein